MPEHYVLCVGSLDVCRQPVDVEVTSHGNATQLAQRRRALQPPTDRVKQSDGYGRLAGGARTQVEQTVAGLRDAHRLVDEVDDVC